MYLRYMREAKAKEQINNTKEAPSITTKIQEEQVTLEDFDWCRDVCMLTVEMSELCEVKRPCPRYGVR